MRLLEWPDWRWRNVLFSDANMGFSRALDKMLDDDNRSDVDPAVEHEICRSLEAHLAEFRSLLVERYVKKAAPLHLHAHG